MGRHNAVVVQATWVDSMLLLFRQNVGDYVDTMLLLLCSFLFSAAVDMLCW